MPSKLFVPLGTLILLSVSVMAHGRWIKYDIEHIPGISPIPQGDCLEMMCEFGCVESDEGQFIGHCCPSNGSFNSGCRTNEKDLSVCCQDGMFCHEGKCVECATDAGPCRKCVNNRWSYPVHGTLVNGNTCQQCNGLGSSFNVAFGTPIDGNACQVCDGNGNAVAAANGSNKQSDGKCCINGTMAYDATLCPNSKCKVGDVWYDNDAVIGTCGKCQNGTVVIDSSKVPTCKVCNTDWQLDDIEDGSNKQSDGKCCVNGTLAYDTTFCPDPTDSQSVSISSSCDVDWVSGHVWQYKECIMRITLPDDGTWELSGDAKVYVGDSSKCYAGIQDGATVQVSGGKIENYTGIDKHAEQFTAYWSYQGSEMTPKLGFTCSTPTITTKGKTIIFKVYVTPHGPHIHVPYAGGQLGNIDSASRI